jgi:hypothetical protein
VRIVGCLLAGVLYCTFAGYALFAIMIGDCLPDEPFHYQCESARSAWLLGLIALSIAVAVGLLWLFFGRHRKNGDVK